MSILNSIFSMFLNILYKCFKLFDIFSLLKLTKNENDDISDLIWLIDEGVNMANINQNQVPTKWTNHNLLQTLISWLLIELQKK